MMLLSQLRERLAAIEEQEGDLEVRFPAMIDPSDEGLDSVEVEGVAIMVDERGGSEFLLLCDVYTLDNFEG